MTSRSKNENHYKAASQVIRKLEFLSHVDGHIVAACYPDYEAEMTLHMPKAVEQRHTDLMKDFLIEEVNTS
jgi:hypothetical protein